MWYCSMRQSGYWSFSASTTDTSWSAHLRKKCRVQPVNRKVPKSAGTRIPRRHDASPNPCHLPVRTPLPMFHRAVSRKSDKTSLIGIGRKVCRHEQRWADRRVELAGGAPSTPLGASPFPIYDKNENVSKS